LSEEDVDKIEKTKYHYAKELVAKFPHAQPTFKNHLEKQFKQMAKHGEQLETSNMYHKQLYGYIQTKDVLDLECVK
jgi:hypothetical protein